MQVICIELVNLYVRMFIPKCEWALWSLFYSDCLFGQALVFFSFHFAWLHCACLICYYKFFLHTIMIPCCYVSGDFCSFDSRAYQILELGVSEFCSTALNSPVKSRVCFRVLSRNSQRGRLQDWILSTILLALFSAKFACILAISNPVFRWESCRGSVWRIA